MAPWRRRFPPVFGMNVPTLLRRLALLALLITVAPALAVAHFSPGTKVRTIVVAAPEGELVAYVRVPTPLLFGDVIRSAQADGNLHTPLLYVEPGPAGLRLRVSLSAIASEAGWTDRLAGALVWSQNGRDLPATLLDWRVVDHVPDTEFATAPAALESLARKAQTRGCIGA